MSNIVTLADGSTARPARLDDAPDMLAIYYAVSQKLIGEPEETLEEIVDTMQEPFVDLVRDVRVVHTPQGELIGFGWVYLRLLRDVEIDLYMHPDYWATDTVVMPYLTAWAETRARDALALVPEHERVTVTAWCYHNDDWYQAHLRQLGLEVVRSSYLMWIDFNELLPAPVLPAGLTIREFRRDEDWHYVFDVRREAWLDMWGFVPRTYEEDYTDWRHYWEKNFQEGYWFVAEQDGAAVGVCLGEPTYNGADDVAYIASVGVRRANRRQGIAFSLLTAALAQFQARGKRAASLYVDASSLTGAVALYERAGMHVKRRFDRMQKELRAGVDQRVQVAGELE